MLPMQHHKMDKSAVSFICKFVLFSCTCIEIVFSQSCAVSFDVRVPFGQLFVEDGLRTCFHCVVDGMTSSQTAWLIQSSSDSNQLEAVDPAHGEVLNGVLVLYNSSTLVKPGFSNAIEAQCSAFEMLYTVFLVSNVFVPPIVMDMTVEEGEDLEICCTDDNPSGLGVTQRWQRLDGTLMTSDAVFTVENASRSHAGIYQCVLTNGMNETLVANATVVIQYLGDVTSSDPPNQDVTLGESLVTLLCNYSGVPDPEVQWFHNDTVLVDSTDDTVRIISHNGYSELQLSDIRRDSGGEYTCNASNIVDWRSVSVQLRILVPPAPATNLTLTINGETTVVLSWMNGFDGYSLITGVEIEIFSNKTLQETRAFPGDNIQSADITGLDPLRNFMFVLHVLNTVGRSDPISINRSISLSIVPPAPVTNLVITNIEEFSTSFSWQNGFNGNAPIIGIEIELYINKQRVETRSFLGGPPQESALLTGLRPFTDYVFRIYVLNAVHRSDPVSIEASTLSLRLSAPTITSVSIQSSSSVRLEWEPPLHDPETTDAPKSWMIEYTYIIGRPQFLTIPNPNATTHTFLNLLKGTQYQVRVAGVNVRGLGMYSEYITVATLSEPPSGSPSNFSAITKSRTITFNWSPPLITNQNGVILSYILTCTLQDSDEGSSEHAQISMVYQSAGSHVLGSFRPFSTYSCSVFATNSAGNGPSISLLLNTKDDSELFQLRLTGVKCTEWVISFAPQKASILASILTNAIQEHCRCVFTRDRITDGVFQCFPDSPQAVTYRAILHGTAELSALGLLDFIKDWSKNDDSATDIRVDSILLRVDHACDVTITSISDKECGLNDDSSSNNPMLAIILGMVGGVAVMLILVMFMIVISYNNCHKNNKRTLSSNFDSIRYRRESNGIQSFCVVSDDKQIQFGNPPEDQDSPLASDVPIYEEINVAYAASQHAASDAVASQDATCQDAASQNTASQNSASQHSASEYTAYHVADSAVLEDQNVSTHQQEDTSMQNTELTNTFEEGDKGETGGTKTRLDRPSAAPANHTYDEISFSCEPIQPGCQDADSAVTGDQDVPTQKGIHHTSMQNVELERMPEASDKNETDETKRSCSPRYAPCPMQNINPKSTQTDV